MEVTESTLKNGLKVRIVNYPGSKLVSSNVIIKTGGRNEDDNTYGISHFVEHLSIKGTKSFPKAGELSERVENLGGIINAWTSEQATCYWNILPEEHLDFALMTLAEEVIAQTFDDDDIEKERGPIIEEIKMRHDDPYIYIYDKIYEVMWPGQPIAGGILGPEKNIKRFEAKDFRDYVSRQYTAKNTEICVATSLNSAVVLEKIEKYFGNLAPEKAKAPLPISHDQNISQSEVVFRDIKQAHLMLGYKTFGVNDPKAPALDVLMTILGLGTSSILHKEVRIKRSAAYTAQAGVDYFTDAGAVLIYAGLDTKKIEEVIRLVKRILKDLTQKALSESRINKAKEFLKGVTLYRLDGVERTAYWYTNKALYSPKAYTPEDYLKRITAVTAKDILAVAKETFKEENESLLILGPFKDKEKFVKILAE